jgi:Centromere DNA-binding protein complex CBF3 subunit, domain 2
MAPPTVRRITMLKNTFICPVGALAHWFFYRREITRETPPDFRSRESWYQLPLLPKFLETPGEDLSSETQGDWIGGCLKRWIFHPQKLLHTLFKGYGLDGSTFGSGKSYDV